MIATQTISLSFRLLILSVRIGWWCVETVWIGAVSCCRAILFGMRLPRILAKTTHCPRGHRVELYGVHRCGRCQGVTETHGFDPCPVCGAKALFLACPRCGLAVRDPGR